MLGEALQLQGRFEEAVSAFETGTQLNPGYWANFFGLGVTHLESGNYPEALSALSRDGELTDGPQIGVYRAAALVGLERIDEAIASLENSFSLGLDDFEAIEGSAYFQPLRDDARFIDLIERYQSR